MQMTDVTFRLKEIQGHMYDHFHCWGVVVTYRTGLESVQNVLRVRMLACT